MDCELVECANPAQPRYREQGVNVLGIHGQSISGTEKPCSESIVNTGSSFTANTSPAPAFLNFLRKNCEHEPCVRCKHEPCSRNS